MIAVDDVADVDGSCYVVEVLLLLFRRSELRDHRQTAVGVVIVHGLHHLTAHALVVFGKT